LLLLLLLLLLHPTALSPTGELPGAPVGLHMAMLQPCCVGVTVYRSKSGKPSFTSSLRELLTDGKFPLNRLPSSQNLTQ
jgi:hypothetical protein